MVMQELKELTIQKLSRKIQSGQATAQKALEKLTQEGRVAQDYIAYIGKQGSTRYDNNGHVQMLLPDERPFSIHSNAVTQLGEKLGVPAPYLRSLADGDEHQRALAARILNDHTAWTGKTRVLVRSVGSEVRGVLSDQYKRLNGMNIIQGFLEEGYNQGAMVADGLFTDVKVYLEMLYPEPIIFPTQKNGDVAVAFGARLSTSDYGAGALELRFFLMQAICLNGMVRESALRQVHLGSKLPDNLLLSQKTYDLDTAATVSAVRDITKSLFSADQIRKRLMEVQMASAEDVDIIRELKNLEKGKILKSESEQVQKLLMQSNPEDGIQGEATLWKLVQGITAHARETTPDRSRQLQEIAGDLMSRVSINQ